MAIKLYLNVPYADREKAKAAGARWDKDEKLWYVEEGADAKALLPWLGTPLYLDTAYKEKDEVKALGALWNAEAKRWFVPAAAELAPFLPWLGNNLYLLIAERICWKCEQPTRVVAFGTPVVSESTRHRGLRLSARPEELPDEVDLFLKSRGIVYRPKRAKSTGVTALHSCCEQCGALQGEHYLFEAPGAPFNPAPDDLKGIHFVRIVTGGPTAVIQAGALSELEENLWIEALAADPLGEEEIVVP